MEILHLLDEFENTIEECSRIPMTGKLIIHEDTLYSYLDRFRGVVPDSIQKASWIMKEKDRIIEEANKEAESIIETAKSKVQRIAGENEIVKLARTQGDEIIENSKNLAKEVTQGAFTYAEDVMSQLQTELEKILQVVRQGREEIRRNMERKG